jgi:hypothetical protein
MNYLIILIKIKVSRFLCRSVYLLWKVNIKLCYDKLHHLPSLTAPIGQPFPPTSERQPTPTKITTQPALTRDFAFGGTQVL